MIYLHAGDGKKKETVEVRFQFGEFVRLQIGDGNGAGYLNWYRISDFYDWQSIVKYQRTENNMKDNGSVQQLDNGNW